MRWISDGSVCDEQQTGAGIEAWECQWDRYGFGLFTLELCSTSDDGGKITLWGVTTSGLPCRTLEYASTADCQGRSGAPATVPPLKEAGSMAADQASAKDETAEPVIARVARAITQPGGMNIDWKKVRAAGAVIAGISVILGVRHRRWRYTHSAGVVLGVAAAAAARLKDQYVKAPENE